MFSKQKYGNKESSNTCSKLLNEIINKNNNFFLWDLEQTLNHFSKGIINLISVKTGTG
jgi:hypothetical protein